jgi:hypothetical protein
MPRRHLIAASSLILLLGCAACANGSTSTYTQAPIFFNDGPAETEEAFQGDDGAFVTAEGNAILPLGPSATPAAAPTPQQGSVASADLSGALSVGPGGLAVATGVSASAAGAAITSGIAASATVSTAPVTLSLRAPVLGAATVSTAVLAAPSAISPALVTSVTSREQGLLCVPSLRLRC